MIRRCSHTETVSRSVDIRTASFRRPGFTVVELLVAIGIIGVLAALLLPAVMQAREASRRLGCSNNLHQIGIAQHSYLETHGMFPGVQGAQGPHIAMLPYLDQAPLYDVIAEHGLAPSINLPLYVCPSEPFDRETLPLEVIYHPWLGPGMYPSYLTNQPEYLKYQSDGSFEEFWLRGFHRHELTRPTHITDGLATTTAMSERLILTISMAHSELPSDHRRVWQTAASYAHPEDVDRFADACLQPSATQLPAAGLMSNMIHFFDDNRVDGYNHILPPNSRSCTNGPLEGSFRDGFKVLTAIVTASSMHRGGVNVLLGDGSVRFVSDSIDRSVWRALGTRDAGDLVANF